VPEKHVVPKSMSGSLLTGFCGSAIRHQEADSSAKKQTLAREREAGEPDFLKRTMPPNPHLRGGKAFSSSPHLGRLLGVRACWLSHPPAGGWITGSLDHRCPAGSGSRSGRRPQNKSREPYLVPVTALSGLRLPSPSCARRSSATDGRGKDPLANSVPGLVQQAH
jgi:hypothetical protein